MTTKPVKIPNQDHPITIEPSAARVVVSVAGKVVADSTRALSLREAAYPPVLYIPRQDVDMSLLARTDHSTYCPYKGDAGYFSLRVGDRFAEDAIWTYETPYEAVSEIKDHVAFYPDRVDSIKESPVD